MNKGVYLDRVTGKLTRTQPARGKVLVQPGHTIPEHIQAALDGNERATAPAAKETATTRNPIKKKP